jgi:hypothetical protein
MRVRRNDNDAPMPANFPAGGLISKFAAVLVEDEHAAVMRQRFETPPPKSVLK